MVDHTINLSNYGPLAGLIGTWEGEAGLDISPSRNGPVNTPYRERRTMEPMGTVVNGPQTLYAVRYASVMWPEGSDDPFHEETGYWLWDPKDQHLMLCFAVPRGVVVNAGTVAEPNAKIFALSAKVGSQVYGIASNPFLDNNFRTIRYDLEITVHDGNSFSYIGDTVLQIPGLAEPFHHKDSNKLLRAPS